MAKRIVVALAVLVAARPAHADTLRRVGDVLAQSQEGEIRQKIEQAREQIQAYVDVANAFYAMNRPIDMRLDAFAEAGAGLDIKTAAGEGTLGLVYAIRGDRCDVVQVGASVRGDLRSTKLTGGAQQWGQLCLSGGLDLNALSQGETLGADIVIFPMVLREGGEIDARPRLTAARSAIDETYSDIGFGFDVEAGRWKWAKNRGVAFAGFSADQKWRWRRWPNETSKVELTGEIWFVRFFRERPTDALADRFIDVFAIGFHGIQADNGAAIVTALPVRIRGLSVDPNDRILVDAEYGFGGTGTISSSTTGPGVHDMTTIGTTGLPDVDATLAHVALHSGDPSMFGSLAYDRTVDTNVLADVITEDRFSLSGQYTDSLWQLRGEAFVSRSHWYLDEDVTADERVAGASFTGSYALPHQLSLGLSVEGVAGLRDRDPALDGHALPRGVRGFLTLSTTRTLAHD